MAKHVTLRDVAQFAGVSVTTVSNVMRDWPYVSPETRLKVQSAINTLGYTPHIVAQGLRTGQMQAIAFIVPELANPYFAEIIGAAEDAAHEHNYTILVFNSHEDAARERACIQRAARHWVDGILIAHTTQTPHNLDNWHDVQLPVVAIDRVPMSYEGAQCALDNVRVGEVATAHLCELGHQRIAVIAGPPTVRPAVDRVEGYRAILARYQLSYERVVYSSSAWNSDDGYRAMQQLLAEDERPTAVVAGNDAVAIGALHAIREHCLDVPGDISIVGVDDIEISRHLNPPLTTVRQPLSDMARSAVDLLLQQIRGEANLQQRVILEPELIVRQSTAHKFEERTR